MKNNHNSIETFIFGDFTYSEFDFIIKISQDIFWLNFNFERLIMTNLYQHAAISKIMSLKLRH